MVVAVGNSLETVGYVGYVTEIFLRLRRAKKQALLGARP